MANLEIGTPGEPRPVPNGPEKRQKPETKPQKSGTKDRTPGKN